MKHKTFIIISIILLAGILRIFRIDQNPPSLSWDEVSIGYNAYSILKTGKDEHGRFLPPDAFAGYGDYKPPLAIYATVPSVAFFGLNEWAVRLPSALFGTLTVYLTYLLVGQLIRLGDRRRKKRSLPEELAPLSAFLMAISPWHINLSRAGFEANIALAFIVLGMVICLRAIREPRWWTVAWLPFVGAVYTFNSSRYFVPFLGLLVLALARRTIREHAKPMAMGIIIAFLALMPILPHLLSKEARLRFAEVNIFTDPDIVLTANRRIKESGNAWWANIVFNRRVGYARSYVLHYLDHFQPEFLFVKGDGNPKFSIRDVGQLHLIEAPFLLTGALAMTVLFPIPAIVLWVWLLASIIPAAVARETPHALRILNSLPTWQVFTAFGILSVAGWVGSLGKGKKNAAGLVMGFWGLIVILYMGSLGYYLHTYYAHYPKEFSGEWQYGYKQALEYIKPLEDKFDTIYMTESIGRPYMYTLFYRKTDPNEFWNTKDDSFDAAGFYHVYGFAKFRFVKDAPAQCSGKCLAIVPAGAQVTFSNKLTDIRLLNGNPILSIYSN